MKITVKKQKKGRENYFKEGNGRVLEKSQGKHPLSWLVADVVVAVSDFANSVRLDLLRLDNAKSVEILSWVKFQRRRHRRRRHRQW